MNTPELSIVVPAYNEATHLEAVISELADVMDESLPNYEILIVNNGSTDDTAHVIEKLEQKYPCIRHIYLEKNQQYGGGIQAGLADAKGDMLGWAHADGQIDPKDIVRLYKGMRESGRELGKAVRVMRLVSKWRRMQSIIWYSIFQILFPSPYRDPNGTPRLLTRHARDVLKLESRDWFLEPEFVIKSLRHKIPIYEVETVWRSRKSGDSKAHLFTGMEFLKNLILYRIGMK